MYDTCCGWVTATVINLHSAAVGSSASLSESLFVSCWNGMFIYLPVLRITLQTPQPSDLPLTWASDALGSFVTLGQVPAVITVMFSPCGLKCCTAKSVCSEEQLWFSLMPPAACSLVTMAMWRKRTGWSSPVIKQAALMNVNFRRGEFALACVRARVCAHKTLIMTLSLKIEWLNRQVGLVGHFIVMACLSMKPCWVRQRKI